MTGRDDTPSIREIAALTARLRELSTSGRNTDPAERAAFLADKDALLARIENTAQAADSRAESPAADEDHDADGWFAEGHDAAHTVYLDELGHVDAEPLDDGRSEAATALDNAHQAVTPLTVTSQRRSNTHSAEAREWARDDQHADTADDDSDVDGDGWSW